MSVSFCVIFETEVPPHGTLGSDTMRLAGQKDDLDLLCNQNGLTPLGAFESYDPADMADFFDEDSEVDRPPVQ
jgi:hypothetical protein